MTVDVQQMDAVQNALAADQFPDFFVTPTLIEGETTSLPVSYGTPTLSCLV